MLNLDNLVWHGNVQQPSESGYATFNGTNLKEVLDEIREYSKDKKCYDIGDGFGNPNYSYKDFGGGAWEIYIDEVPYWSCYSEANCKKYDSSLDDIKVKEIWVDGFWYSWGFFWIKTENEQLKDPKWKNRKWW